MEITRKIEFDAGHRVWGHESKCAHIHGHRYVAEVTVSAAALDRLGRVTDFSVIKQAIGHWIDTYWDHNLLLHKDDPMVSVLATAQHGRTAWIMSNGNPTAENIAQELFVVCNSLLPAHITTRRVRIYETPNCWADYSE